MPEDLCKGLRHKYSINTRRKKTVELLKIKAITTGCYYRNNTITTKWYCKYEIYSKALLQRILAPILLKWQNNIFSFRKGCIAL
jgi:hypothetical protein